MPKIKLKPLDAPEQTPRLHALPGHLVQAIASERKAHGPEAGRVLAKAIIAAPPNLRNVVPLKLALQRFGNGK